MLHVTLARAAGDEVRCDALDLPAGATVADALAHALRAGLLAADEVQAVEAGTLTVAVHGRSRAAGHPLRDGDRIELLGPLTVDPKVARQRRVAHRRAAQARDKWSGAGR
jgi:putative ubiquitin-RnfH superfamily antitoxin RatB of RatAB toxin-antitoxin module